MRNPNSYYTDTIYISPLGITFLVVFGIVVVFFIVFRKKLPVKTRLYTALVIAVLTGFAIGVTIDEIALAKSGTLTSYHRTKIPAAEIPYYDDCPVC